MSNRLDSNKIGDSVRAMALQHCRSISRSLVRRRDLHAGIHQARKAIRRLRALLALIAERFEQVAAIDHALRTLGHSLSDLRDAHVAVELARAFAAQANEAAWHPMIALLTQRRDRLTARLMARDPGFSRRRAVASRQASALDALEWHKLRKKDLQAGRDRSLARLARADRRAQQELTAENLHRFRRRLRRLRMQQEALRTLVPTMPKNTTLPGKDIRSLRRYSDRLGRRQDVLALYALVRRAPGLPDRRTLLDQLRKDIPSATGDATTER